jgi:DnaJ-class molecular chaperone
MNTIERGLGERIAPSKPHLQQALAMLELSTDSMETYDEATITKQWRKINLKYHPNRPGGSSIHLAKCQSACQSLLQAYRNTVSVDPKTSAISPSLVSQPSYMQTSLAKVSRSLPPAYKIALHDGLHKLVLSLKVNVVDLLMGKPVYFKHIDGKTYKIQSSQGQWGGWAELPRLGLSPILNAQSPGEVVSTEQGPLIVILQPLFPTKVPITAIELIKQGIEIAHAENAQSEIVQDWMPALTM